MTVVPVDIIVVDQVSVTEPDAAERYAKITTIRVQDVARHIWFSWDDPARTFNAQPTVTLGPQNLEVIIWAVNMKSTTQVLVLKLTRVADNAVLAHEESHIPVGQTIAIHYIGAMTTLETELQVNAEYLVQPSIGVGVGVGAGAGGGGAVMPVIEIPDLPWYAAWLTPVIQYIAAYGNAVINYVFGAANPLVQAAQNLMKLPGILTGDSVHIAPIGPLYCLTSSNKVRELITGQLPEMTRLIDPEEYFAVGAADNEIAAAFSKLWTDGNTTLNLLNMGVFAAELASLGQVEAAQRFVDSALSIYPFQGVMSKVASVQLEAAWVKPIQRQVNAKWLPERPSIGEQLNMVVKGVLTVEQFIDNAKGQGLSMEWTQRLWDAHYAPPGYAQIGEAYWRGLIKEEELEGYFRKADLDPKYDDVLWRPLLETIPGTGELVNERVKEVIDQPEFEKGLGWWGMKGKWATRIWDAHFIPATWNDFLTAMRRKQTVSIPVAFQAPKSHTFGVDAAADIQVIKQLSELADYDPRYWDFFKQRMYNDPTPRMSMWSYDTGVVSEEKLREIVHRYGYWPEDEKWYGDMLVHFQERPWVTKYLMVLASAYIGGAISAEELKKRVLAIPRNEAIANYIIKIADVRKEIAAAKPTAAAEKLLSVADLRRLTVEGIMDMDVFRTELESRGYSYEDAEYLVQLVQLDRIAEVQGKKTVTLSIVEWLNAWRYNVITEEKLRIELSLRGLPQDELETLIATKKRQWTISPGGD